MKKTLCLIILILVLLSGCSKSEEKKASLVTIAIEVENYGTIEAELYPDIAPKTVENFLKNIERGIYENSSFHRIIDGFMIQGGRDLSGKAQKIEGEFSSNGFENNLLHETGVLSMARSKDKNSATSQFFIVLEKADWLDGEYAAFGKVINGMSIVRKIAKDAKPIDNNGTIPEDEQPVIKSVTVLKKTPE